MAQNEINWAERQREITHSPTLEQCKGQGRTHKAYGWGFSPYGNWTPEQKEAYYIGFHGANKTNITGDQTMLENSQQFKSTERMINRLDEVIPFPSEWAGIADDMSQAERLKIADNLSNLAVMVARFSAYIEKRATADHAAAVTSQNVIAQRTRKALGYTFTEEKRIF